MTMKTVFQTSELVHIWAAQKQEEGKNSGRSVFFNGPKIYSYGYHFCMGNIIKPGIVLITTRKHSVTTSSHVSSAFSAVNHMEIIEVPYPENESLEKNLSYWISDIKDLIAIIENPRKKQDTKDRAKGELSRLVEIVNRFLEVTEQSISKKLPFESGEKTRKEFLLYFDVAKNLQALPDLKKKLEAKEKADEQLRLKRIADTIKEAKAKLLQWRKGGKVYAMSGNGLPVYLRVEDDEITTSAGARVSIKAGKVLFNMIQSGRDVKGHSIDGYTVISVNGVLKIGCHEIDMKEVKRFAKTQGW
jgi:hypothetical protein